MGVGRYARSRLIHARKNAGSVFVLSAICCLLMHGLQRRHQTIWAMYSNYRVVLVGKPTVPPQHARVFRVVQYLVRSSVC